ncbi:MAG: hypothetical protein K9M80_04335 [Candidatus Marinimicrobia bacterium]|nr:hypothetical protein [Candidatus Neomarinimicrobiota bacterium]
MSDYHEPQEKLSEKARSLTRALNSLKEEVEAVDWYNQRRDVEKDKALQDILKHNMLEEIEHACMTIEWLRRNMEGWDEELETYLFKEEDITDLE